MAEDPNVVATIDLPKNDRGDVIRLQINRFPLNTGKFALDVRQYYTDAAGQLKPTQKGTRVPLDQVLKFSDAVQEMVGVVADMEP